MNFLNAPQDLILQNFDDKIIYDFELAIFKKNSKVKFQIDEISTSWIDLDDLFLKRIQYDKLNHCFIKEHIKKEMEIKNILDEGIELLDLEKFPKAIEKFDKVILYDSNYSQALLFKSYALYGQNHFIKSFRFYKKAIKINEDLRDNEYHKLLKAKSSKERDNFPKIKMFIFTGDEYLSRGNFKEAIRYYDKALANPSKFKSKIVYKLLNKKATALFELKRYEESLNCFKDSLEIHQSDYAYFHAGVCAYHLKENPDFYLNRASNIKKDQLLQKALVFSEIGLFDECIESLDELFLNHYAPDKLYFTALNLKISVLEKSDRNSTLEKTILDNLNF